MSESTAFNLSGAQLPDDTIDFYTLLGESPNASTEQLRSKIGAIYSEAQANRDHRNLNKRREYQALLELLPPARAALLEAPKRERYDDFLAKAKNGAAPSDFETFINDLMGFNEPMEEKTGLPTLKPSEKAEPRARTIQTPAASPSKSPAASKPAATPRPTAPSSPSPSPSPVSKSGGASLAPVGAIAGFIVGVLLGFLLLHHLLPALLIGIVLAAIGFVVLNSKPSNKVKM